MDQQLSYGKDSCCLDKNLTWKTHWDKTKLRKKTSGMAKTYFI